MSAQHTPTPWSEPYWDNEPGDRGWWIHNGKKGSQEYAIAVTSSLNPNGKADGAFIVRACNAHDDLVAALGVVRRSSGWGSLAAETRALIDAALVKAGVE